HRRFGTRVESSGFSDPICFDSAISLNLLRRKLLDKVAELIPLGHAFSRKPTVKQLFSNDRARHCVQERNVCARSWLKVNSGVLTELDSSGIDDDQVRALQSGLLDSCAD